MKWVLQCSTHMQSKSSHSKLSMKAQACDEVEAPHFTWFLIAHVSFDLQDDHKAFRRQLEDKRPIVESNLLSGKQYVASEPPVSDASDTERKNIDCFIIFVRFPVALKKKFTKINCFLRSIGKRFTLFIGRRAKPWANAQHFTRGGQIVGTMESTNRPFG